ncbi:AAA family ATPase [Aeoliella sp. SH292]|uniref:AAA family ATPase n=1 Tax=Aeoliella sp. SH292 TaxID=3454464 RepID=UPI003F95CF68
MKNEFAYLEGQLPLTICRGKAPTPMGHNWQTQRLDYDTAERLIDRTEFVELGTKLGPGAAIDFDIDGPSELEAFLDLFDGEPPVLPAYTSGRTGGEHRLAAFDNRLLVIGKATVKYKTTDGKHSVTVRIGCKVQSDGTIGGAQSIIPPSYHTAEDENGRLYWTGRQYQWKPNLSLEEIGLPQLPSAIIDKLLAAVGPQNSQESGVERIADDSTEYGPGNRHDHLCSLAGSLRSRGCSFATILSALKAENETKCKPPKPVAEVVDIANYYAKAKVAASIAVPLKPSPKITYQRISSRELGTGDYSVEYLIENTLVAGQPTIIGGKQKTLKTSFIVDAAVSLSMGGYFLGKLKVNRACRVAVMTGESGMATIQETARRVCIAAGAHLEECDNLIWSPDLPKFGQPAHADALREFIQNDEIEVLFIDPMYLCMPSTDSSNLMAQGELLRSMGDVVQPMGVTMIVAHHLKKSVSRDAHDPPELEDLAWAGFAEWARQWWLLGRRETYQPGTGDHRLWLNVGGSAGHSALWAVDVSEGVRSESSERHWGVELRLATDARSEAQGKAQAAREARAEQQRKNKAEADRSAVVQAMHTIGRAETLTAIAETARISNARARAALMELKTAEQVRESELKKSNGQTYPVFELNHDDE